MPEFCIKDTEIQDLIHFSILQGGSKYRQKDIYALLDRVVARGPVPEVKEMPDVSAKVFRCPECKHPNPFPHGILVRNCAKCGENYFRRL